MIKKILKQIWNHKLATFVLFAGCFESMVGELVIGTALISVSIALFDDEN